MIRRSKSTVGALALIVTLPSLALAQRDLKNIPDPDPEIERKSFQVADGFEVNLYAADPLLAKPIQMNFDPQGRLWVVSSEVYPQIKPGQAANDRVLILEDRDGNGSAEKSTVFADGLLIPTGIEPGDGGAYVGNSTELLHFRDRDGDGKADERRVVLSGFGTEDTHHILHTLRWGHDGQLYFNQSIYIHSHIETPYGVRRLGGGGIWRFRPETLELDVFIRGLVNPWGHHMDRWGQSFATDGAGGEGINYCLPGAYYFTAPDAVRILHGLNPGSPKHCGLEVVSGRHLPDDWQGSLVTNDFRANRVCRFVVSDDGAGFASKEQPELIKTTHGAFRPIDVKMGPDGAIYIADWYNPIIQHGEVDFRDPRRDHAHGRIWRVTAKGRPLVPRPKLVDAPTNELLDAMKAPEEWTRRQAKRVLKERGAAVLPSLRSWLAGLDPRDTNFEHHRLEALWTFQALNTPEPELLASLLGSTDPRVRAAAVRVVDQWLPRLPDAGSMLARCVEDENPRVRLEAVRGCAKLGGLQGATIAMTALSRPVDQFLDYALWLTARETAPAWLPALQRGDFDFGGRPDAMVFALNAVGSAEAVKPLLAALHAGRPGAAQKRAAMNLAAELGRAEDLGAVLDLVLNDTKIPAADRATVLENLAASSRRRKLRPSGDPARITALLESSDEPVRAAAARAGGAWGVESLRPKLTALVLDERTDSRTRTAAIDGLIALGGSAGRNALTEVVDRTKARPVRVAATVGLASIDLNAAAAKAAALLSETPAGEDPGHLVSSFLERRGGADALAKALVGKQVPPDAAKLAVRLAAGTGGKNPALVDTLTAAGGLTSAPKPPTGAEREALLTEVALKGDPARGEVVFRDKRQACLKCHAIAGAGGQVGPGLESVGASAPLDYLLDSLFEPEKAVKENYHALVIATKDGRVITGLKIRETADELVLRDAEDTEVVVPIAEIDDRRTGGSIMPAGQIDALTRTELVDLLRFLSELGKVGPYSVGKETVARSWRILDPSREPANAFGNENVEAVAKDETAHAWSPAYSRVSGTLPPDAVPAARIGQGAKALGLARCRILASAEGDAELRITGLADGFEYWLDGRKATGEAVTRIHLGPGEHTLTFAVPEGTLTDGLRCELREVPGSAAKPRFALGK